MSKRKNPNYKLKIKLLQEVRLKCPFCDFSDASKLEHHHIDRNPSNTVFENLISVCPNCHSKIEAGEISNEQVLKTKTILNTNSKFFNEKGYTFDNFRIHYDRVGIFKKGMTIKEIYTILPKNQIKKSITYGEHGGEDLYDSYKIYDSNGEHILTLESSEKGNLNDEIKLITIHSSRFHTLSKVRIGTSISEVMLYENIKEFEPDIEFIHFKIDWISAICSINKKQLKNGWWNELLKKIELKSENLNVKIDSISIFW